MLRLGTAVCIRNLFSSFIKKPVPDVPEIKNFPLQTTQFIRTTSFFNKVSADMLWKGVISVSNAGKKKGRGKGSSKKEKKHLYLGKRPGIGAANMIWPGLSCSVIQNKTVVPIHKSSQRLMSEEQVSTKKKKNFEKLDPLNRGWTGKTVRGKRLGPPDPVGDDTFEQFECIIVDQKLVSTMTAVLGRKRSYFSCVLTGNRNGLIGLGKAKSLDSKSSVRRAQTRAIKRLLVIDLIDKHTVNHDFFCEFGKTKIFVFKKPEGYGLICHRVLAACCELIGIKNLYAKIEGPVNINHVLKAFLLGLLKQKTYQQIADEKKLHLVEFREERLNFPSVLASPEVCLTPLEARKTPANFEEYIMGDRVVYEKPKRVPFYQKLPSWSKHLKRSLYRRNFDKVKIELLAEYGEYKSFLQDRYPECTSQKYIKKEKEL